MTGTRKCRFLFLLISFSIVSSEGGFGFGRKKKSKEHKKKEESTASTTTTKEKECDIQGNCHDDTTGSRQQQQPTTMTSNKNNSKQPQQNPQPECGLYLAPSTINGAGLGVFSGVDKNVGDKIGESDICLPFLNMYWHQTDTFFPNPFRDYFWQGASMGMAAETDSDDIEAYCPGLDCAVNCNPSLLNVAKSTPVYDEAGLHRSSDPGAGARTPYHNGTTKVIRDIPAGGELFKDYGQNWFDYRYKIFGEIPFEENYDEAQQLLKNMMGLKISKDDQTMSDLYNTMKVLKISHATKGSSFRGRVLNALPEDYKDAKWANDHSLQDLHQPAATRSIEFLRANGRCMDHIVHGISTIKQAGQGAFAKRALPAGTIITASPLNHVQKSFANIYNFTRLETGEYVRITDDVIGKQLMLNYCYSRRDFDWLLCPYGSGINYINHHRRKANVKIRWAKDFPLAHNATAVTIGSLSALEERETPFLAFEYITTKHIPEGAELFLDYGGDWVYAWEEHLSKWKPYGDHPERYASARYMNEHYGDSILRTEEEQKHDPYPDHIQIRCHNGLLNADGKTLFHFNLRDYGLACQILHRDERTKGQYYYTVELEFTGEGDQIHRIIRANIPRVSLAYFDIPGTTDLNLPNAFRHEIGIPDNMLPEGWKIQVDDEDEGEEAEEEESEDEEDSDDDDGDDDDGDGDDDYDDDFTYDEAVAEDDDDIVLMDDEILFEEEAERDRLENEQ